MARLELNSFNREKLVFLLAAGLFAGCVYKCVVSGPAVLTVGRPLTVETVPPPMVVPHADAIADPTELVDRERKTPFSPTYWHMAKQAIAEGAENAEGSGLAKGKLVKADKPAIIPPIPPVPPTVTNPKDEKSFPINDWVSKVDFMGVVIMPGGKSYGMLKEKDSRKNLKIQAGDKLGDLKYTVVSVTRQEIEVRDDLGHFCTLKNIAGQKPAAPAPEVSAKTDDDGDGSSPNPMQVKFEANGHKPALKPQQKSGAKGAAKEKSGEKQGASPTGNSVTTFDDQANSGGSTSVHKISCAGFEAQFPVQPRNSGYNIA